ncbi:MAG: hypothetical protein WBL44_13275 [Nitrososphaeraceae archaeon]
MRKKQKRRVKLSVHLLLDAVPSSSQQRQNRATKWKSRKYTKTRTYRISFGSMLRLATNGTIGSISSSNTD